MNKNNYDLSSVRRWYESPVVQVVDVESEGVLCQSGQFEEWKEESLDW